MVTNTEKEGICYYLRDITRMQTTAHRLASLWITVRTQLRDSRGAQAPFEREPARYHTPEILSHLSTALCHRI
jgi:hypothetical protein